MTRDMLRLAGEGEDVRTEAFACGEAAESRSFPAPFDPAPGRASPIDLRALVMRAVVPRLAENLRHRPGRASPARPTMLPAASPAVRLPDVEDRDREDRDRVVGELVDALLRDDLAGVCRSIEAERADGRPLERVYLDLLVPAAAAVDRLVAADDCSAAAGTLAFCNLQLVLRRYAVDFYEEGGMPHRGSRALLVSAGATDGESIFGLLLAADFLRRAGWEALVEPSVRAASIAQTVRGQWFDLVQILIDHRLGDDGAAEAAMHDVAAGIRAIRRDGANRSVAIVACGPLVAGNPELVGQIGADHGWSDPLSASSLLDQISSQTRKRRHLS